MTSYKQETQTFPIQIYNDTWPFHIKTVINSEHVQALHLQLLQRNSFVGPVIDHIPTSGDINTAHPTSVDYIGIHSKNN